VVQLLDEGNTVPFIIAIAGKNRGLDEKSSGKSKLASSSTGNARAQANHSQKHRKIRASLRMSSVKQFFPLRRRTRWKSLSSLQPKKRTQATVARDEG